MPLSDDSSELSPSLAELTTPTVAATTATTADQPAPEALASSGRNTRPVFPVTILGPTNSSDQAPPNRHDEGDVDTCSRIERPTSRALSECNATTLPLLIFLTKKAYRDNSAQG